MGSRREKSPIRRMHKIALIICEGETEAEYVNIVKKWYKSPVKVITHIEGNRVTQTLVDRHKRELKISSYDNVETFLMYDMDVVAVTEKIQLCKAELLLSNPCFEVWLLLHCKSLKTPLSSTAAIKELKKSLSVWNNYDKACYTETQKAFLKSHINDAISRAKELKKFQNPSSTVYKLLEFLEKEIK